MIGPKQLIIGLVWGSILIVLGLAPGLFQNLTADVRRFGDSLHGSFGSLRQEEEKVPQPTWLAAVGTSLIFLTLLAYFSE